MLVEALLEHAAQPWESLQALNAAQLDAVTRDDSQAVIEITNRISALAKLGDADRIPLSWVVETGPVDGVWKRQTAPAFSNDREAKDRSNMAAVDKLLFQALDAS